MRGVAVTFACAGLALSPPAHAQSNNDDYTPLNSRIRRDRQFPLTTRNDWKPAERNKVNRKRSHAMRGQFSKCIYRRNETQALELLKKTDYGFVNFQQIGMETKLVARVFGFDDCLERVADLNNSSVVMHFTAAGLRQWLVEEAYFERYPDGPDWVKPGYVIDQRTYPLSQDNPGVHAAMDFADCVVAGDPNTADYFFRAPAGSDEEKEAEQKLIPSLAPCIPKGQKMQIDPAALRVWLGEALWFAANNSSPAPAEPTGGSK